MTNHSTNASRESSRSAFWSSVCSSGLCERSLAIIGAILLRFFGKLPDDWTALVLTAAFGGPAIAWVRKKLTSPKDQRQ